MRIDYSEGYPLRSLNEITEFTIHHTGSDLYSTDTSVEQTARAVYRQHVLVNGWPNPAYAYLYSPKFRCFAWLGNWDTIRYHAGGAYSVLRDGVWVGINNVVGLAICIAGDYQGKDPDQQTLQDVKSLITDLSMQLPTRDRRIVGHQEVSTTVCPGDNWFGWKSALQAES